MEVGEEESEWWERVEERLEGVEKWLKVITVLIAQAVKTMDQRWPEADEDEEEEDIEEVDEVVKAATGGGDGMELD